MRQANFTKRVSALEEFERYIHTTINSNDSTSIHLWIRNTSINKSKNYERLK
jgi:hypothetical protein